MPQCVYKKCSLGCRSLQEHSAKYAAMREKKSIYVNKVISRYRYKFRSK
jgi:hypothetical protein